MQENHLGQVATVDQQRELMQDVRRLKGWREREIEERHYDLRRLRASFEQICHDIYDLEDGKFNFLDLNDFSKKLLEESTPSTSDDSSKKGFSLDAPPQQVPEMLSGLPYPIAKPLPNDRQPPVVDPQTRPISAAYTPRPVPVVPKQAHARQQLPPRQSSPGVSPEPPPFVLPKSSERSVQSWYPSTPTPVPIPPRTRMSQNVVVIPESSSSTGINGTPGDQSFDRSFPMYPRHGMGSDVTIFPLSTSSTQTSTPARNTSQLASHRSVTSLKGPGTVRRTPSGRSQRSRIPLIITNSSNSISSHRPPGFVSSVAQTPTVVRPAALRQQAQRAPQPVPAAMTAGPMKIQEAEFSILRPPQGPMAVGPVLPRADKGPRVNSRPPAIIRQHSPISRHRVPVQPVAIKTSQSRLSKHRRPQPTVTAPPPSQPINITPPPPPQVVLMPTRTDTMRRRQSRPQLHPINTSIVVPTPTVTAMTYPEPTSHFQATTRFSTTPSIIPQRSSILSSDDSRTSTSTTRQPAVIKTSRVPLRNRSQLAHPPPLPVRKTSPSRLIKRRRPQPTSVDPEAVVLPAHSVGSEPLSPSPLARSGTMRSRQSRPHLRPIDISTVTTMAYPETDSHARTSARLSGPPLIVSQHRSASSSNDSRASVGVEQPVITRTPAQPRPQSAPTPRPHSSTPRRARPVTAIPIAVMPPSIPVGNILPSSREIVVMPARGVSRRSWGRLRDRIWSTDSSPVSSSGTELNRLSVPQRSNDVGSDVLMQQGSDSQSLFQLGPVIVPLDSETEEVMGFRRASFSGRDWINYATRSSSTDSYGQGRRSTSPQAHLDR